MLMDAVAAVMREKGYAAVSARSVAERAGLNYQLVFYYFPRMDDLLLATYRRRTERVLEGVELALASARPLHAFWETASEPSDAALTMEYMALSNHNEVIRAETILFGEFMRQVFAVKLSERFKANTPEPALFRPLAISLALNNVGSILGLESALAISGGHAALKGLVGWCLEQLEPPRPEACTRWKTSRRAPVPEVHAALLRRTARRRADRFHLHGIARQTLSMDRGEWPASAHGAHLAL